MMDINWKYSIIVAVVSVLVYVVLVKLLEPSFRTMESVGSFTDAFSTLEFYMAVSVFVGYNLSQRYLTNV
jgi:hypothetical protein